MKKKYVYFFIPLIGYTGLWILGSALFLIYFRIFNISMDPDHTLMIQKTPVLLAVLTPPLCGFVSYFITTKIVLGGFSVSLSIFRLFQTGGISLLTAISLDLLITVAVQKIDILVFPVNLIYLFTWMIIIPSVVLAGYQKQGNDKSS